jgi:hypothetical protein
MAIIRGVRFGYDIAQETGLPVRRLYLALVRLEVKGMIKGYWETDLYDRPHRAYEVVDD